MNAARQMGFADRRQCPHLCKLATEYIIKSDGCEEDMYNYFSNEPDADSLFIKLVEEFERCILSYFAFHWSHVPYMMSQVYQTFQNKCPMKTKFEMCIVVDHLVILFFPL